MIAIFKREFKSYFINMSGYLFISVLLLFSGIFVTMMNLIGQYTGLQYSLQNLAIVFLLIIPILAMRSIAEDKHIKTDNLLYSLPMKLSSVVLGKYFAMVAVLLIPTLVMCVYPLVLKAFGNVSLAGDYTAILGLFLLGCALIAACMFLSSLTESQIIAAVSSLGVCLLLYFMNSIAAIIPSTPIVSLLCLLATGLLVAWIVYAMSKTLIAAMGAGIALCGTTLIAFLINKQAFDGLFGKLLGACALFDRYSDFSLGLFDLKAILYYVSFSVFFLLLTVQSLEKKRWS